MPLTVRRLVVLALFTSCQCARLRDDLAYRCEPGGVFDERCADASTGGGGEGEGGGNATAGGASAGGSSGGTSGGGGSGGGSPARADGFQWENPLPSGHAINGIAARPNEIVAVGDHGFVLRWSGGAWQVEDSGTTLDLNAVAFSSAGDLFAVGSAGIILERRADAGAWSERARLTSANRLNSVAWVPDEERFWVVGEGSYLEQWAPGIESGLADPLAPVAGQRSLRAVDATKTVATNNELYGRDAGGWTRGYNVLTSDLYAVAHPYAAGYVGGAGTVLTFNGATWEAASTSTRMLPAPLRGVVRVGTGCMAVGEMGTSYFCANDTGVSYPRSDIDLHAVANNGTLVAGGRSAVVLSSDGGSWVELDTGFRGPRCGSLRAIDGTGPNRLFAGGTGSTIVTREAGGAWTRLGTTGLPTNVRDVAAAPNGDVWVAGEPSRVKGFLLDAGEVDFTFDGGPLALAATRDQLWVVGSTGRVTLRRRDGGITAYDQDTNDWNAVAIYGDGEPGTAYVVGGQSLYVAGTATTVNVEPLGTLRDIWAAPTGELFMVGENLQKEPVAHRATAATPNDVTRLATCSKTPLVAVHGSSATDVWVIGAESNVVYRNHGDGGCEEWAVPTAGPLTDLFVTPTEVWVTGRDCAVFHLYR
ncbi:MAG: hypothetical protein JNK82_07865 [Myxococcaceae bacterium]|nr:hypothetical protein [Myxococcaceae bacterium]